MGNQEFELLVKKAVENAPEWLKEDLNSIVKKADHTLRISFVISELYNRYTFSFKHIASAMHQSAEWQLTSQARLNFIDNNIDLIQYMLEKKQS